MKPTISGFCKKLRREISYTPDGLIEGTSHDSHGREYILSGFFNCPEYGDFVEDCPYIETCEVAENYQSALSD